MHGIEMWISDEAYMTDGTQTLLFIVHMLIACDISWNNIGDVSLIIWHSVVKYENIYMDANAIKMKLWNSSALAFLNMPNSSPMLDIILCVVIIYRLGFVGGSVQRKIITFP